VPQPRGFATGQIHPAAGAQFQALLAGRQARLPYLAKQWAKIVLPAAAYERLRTSLFRHAKSP